MHFTAAFFFFIYFHANYTGDMILDEEFVYIQPLLYEVVSYPEFIAGIYWGIACVRYIGIIWKEDKLSRLFSRLIAYSGIRETALNDDVCLFYYPIILRLFSIMIFCFYCRRPFGVLHLQPRLCDLLFCGVLLFAVYCHSAGLHPHLRLPQDEAEEDHFWTGQWKGAARLHPTVCGESVSIIRFFSGARYSKRCFMR